MKSSPKVEIGAVTPTTTLAKESSVSNTWKHLAPLIVAIASR